eukprot:104117-Ditylum_brightwellii.AAC.1
MPQVYYEVHMVTRLVSLGFPHSGILLHTCRCKLCLANKTSSPSAATICFKCSSGRNNATPVQNYRQLTSAQLTTNLDKLQVDYDPTNPIEKYIARVKKCLDTAANGGAPYSQEQILTITYGAMYRTGLYNEKCIAWEDLPMAQKAWLEWKIFFTK